MYDLVREHFSGYLSKLGESAGAGVELCDEFGALLLLNTALRAGATSKEEPFGRRHLTVLGPLSGTNLIINLRVNICDGLRLPAVGSLR